ncbi:SRPBCC family protein [Promicromonospora sp. NPDC050880]|uniref:SRPBCC family protein n=1 Tax=Promicromonospora sp. NPDC050880 TaxID=3364406 RepID=UPI0037BC8873
MAHAYRTSAPVDAPAAVVWQILSDVERMPAWTRSMTRVSILDGTRLAVGSRVEIEQPGLPRATWEVDGLTEGRGFSWSSSTPGVRTGAAHLIAPVPGEDGETCEVTLVVAQSGMLAGLTNLALGSRMRELVDTELAGLVAESERIVREKD